MPTLIAMFAIVASACSASATPSPVPTATAAPPTAPPPATAATAPTAPSTPSAEASAAPSYANVPLIVYSAQGYDSAVVKAFQAATGIPTQLVDDSTGPLLVKIQAEANNPKWGVLWVDGAEAFAALDKQGMLLQGFEPNVPFNAVGRSLIPADSSYIPTGITMAGTLVYDSKVVTAPPTSWNDLLTAPWKNAVGMNNPSVSGPTYPFVAGLMNYAGGVSQGEAFFTKLKANGLKVNNTNPDTLHALETKQIRIALIQSSAGIGAGIANPSIKTAFIDPSTPIPGVIGIDAKASPAVIAEAKAFAAYVLSPAGQKVMQGGDPTGDSLYWPIVDGVSALPQLPALSAVPAKAIDPYTWGPLESTINRWFSDTIVP
ncbi:MAG: ABC transporter substrate-binding protein [Candidatus Limnocylindrales bacterium]